MRTEINISHCRDDADGVRRQHHVGRLVLEQECTELMLSGKHNPWKAGHVGTILNLLEAAGFQYGVTDWKETGTGKTYHWRKAVETGELGEHVEEVIRGC